MDVETQTEQDTAQEENILPFRPRAEHESEEAKKKTESSEGGAPERPLPLSAEERMEAASHSPAVEAVAQRVQEWLDRYQKHNWSGMIDYEGIVRDSQNMALHQMGVQQGMLPLEELMLLQLEIQEQVLKADFNQRCISADVARLNARQASGKATPKGPPIRLALPRFLGHRPPEGG